MLLRRVHVQLLALPVALVLIPLTAAAPVSAADACPTARWATPPRLVIHNGELGAGAVQRSQMQSAIEDVVDELNRIGGISTYVDGVTTTYDPFVYGNWDGVATPTIHVGFTDDLLGDTGTAALAAETRRGTDVETCDILEAQIVLPGWGDPFWSPLGGQQWNFETPFDSSADRYYDTRAQDRDDFTWFRPVFLHELLHAFGLDHTQVHYSYMNHRGEAGFPWANRDPEASVRPLPADIAELRLRYPADDTYYDVSVTNTWFKPDTTDLSPQGSANQVLLCTPSQGDKWSAITSSGPCGANLNGGFAATTACEGDKLRVRFALNNASTEDVEILYSLYFSESPDEQLFNGNDVLSPDPLPRDIVTVDAAESALVSKAFDVPALDPGVSYRPIVRIVSWSAAGDDALSVRDDEIPLRGIVSGCTA